MKININQQFFFLSALHSDSIRESHHLTVQAHIYTLHHLVIIIFLCTRALVSITQQILSKRLQDTINMINEI